MKTTHSIFIASILAAATGCSSLPADTDRATAAVAEPVQAQGIGASGTFALDTGTSGPILATGAFYVPMLDHTTRAPLMNGTTQVRGTCGVTFITSQYAITAAHCADMYDDFDPPNQMFQVDQFDISSVSSSRLVAAETVGATDTFPNYTHAQLSATDGYRVKTYNKCHVVVRCYGPTDSYMCPAGVYGDIELLKCDDRPLGSPALPVAASDSMSGPVAVNWFHEVLTGMPTGLSGVTNTERLNHYTTLLKPTPTSDYEHDQNFHYLGGNKNQLLPLHSEPFHLASGPVQHQRLGDNGSWEEVWTDLYGCHGTSGSGVLAMDGPTPALLGPTLHPAGIAWGTSTVATLCMDPALVAPGAQSLSYEKLVYTQAIAAVAYAASGEWPPACTSSNVCQPGVMDPYQTITCQHPVDLFRRDSVGAIYPYATATTTYSEYLSLLPGMQPDVLLACPPGAGIVSSCESFSMYSSTACPVTIPRTCNGVARPTKSCLQQNGWHCCSSGWACGFCL